MPHQRKNKYRYRYLFYFAIRSPIFLETTTLSRCSKKMKFRLLRWIQWSNTNPMSDTLPKLLSPLIPTYSVGVLYGGPGDSTAGKLGILLRGSGSEEDLGLPLSLSRVHRHLVGHVSEFRVTIRSPLKTITNLIPEGFRNRYDQNKEIRSIFLFTSYNWKQITIF